LNPFSDPAGLSYSVQLLLKSLILLIDFNLQHLAERLKLFILKLYIYIPTMGSWPHTVFQKSNSLADLVTAQENCAEWSNPLAPP